jgi:hypothetical protein
LAQTGRYRPGGRLAPAAYASPRLAKSRGWRATTRNDTFTTRFERERQGTPGYDFDINRCKIAGQRPLQGTTGNTRDTPPR